MRRPKNSQQHLKCMIAAAIASTITTGSTQAAELFQLEEIVVTAQKRAESIQDVPISIATLSDEGLESLFSAGEDVLALSTKIPGLYLESSNGRAAPRFYIRGLGNVDFDLAASQPVSVVVDEVVQENVVLKSFPIFDIAQVEMVRGPQGTLFGRNTTAGIVKFETHKPTQELDGYGKINYGRYGSVNIEGAIGGAIVEDKLAGRFSLLSQSRDDWIDNGHTGEDDVMGGYDELAFRAQLLYTPTDVFSALLSYHQRDLDGTASIFRANVINTRSNSLNSHFDRDTVFFDGGDNNPQEYEGSGGLLNLNWDFLSFSIVSVTGFEETDGSSRGDIDGGTLVPGPSAVPFPSVTEDGADVEQFTQELRIASDSETALKWQAGVFYFDSELEVTTESFASFAGPNQRDTIVEHENQTWAVFAQLSYDFSEEFNGAVGVRYTDDEKDFSVVQHPQEWSFPDVAPISLDDDQVSWDVSGKYHLDDNSNLYGRISSGFRAQSIQGRDVAFLLTPTTADSETILSFEVGIKTVLLDQRLRLNGAVYYYEIDDMQLSAIGGATNGNQLLNADKGVGQGLEVDLEFAASENLSITAGFSYNDTEIQDDTLETAACGTGQCTVTDRKRVVGFTTFALIDGNPFQSAPETTFNFTLRYGIPISSGEIFIFTDWAYQGDTNIMLYESKEFHTDGQFEGGLRVGYANDEHNFAVALYGRNITDEENIKGIIDFNNNTAFVNEPAVWGLEFSIDL